MKTPLKVWLKRNLNTPSEKLNKVLEVTGISPETTVEEMQASVTELPLKILLKAYQTIKAK